jgi:hypothetical protein
MALQAGDINQHTPVPCFKVDGRYRCWCQWQSGLISDFQNLPNTYPSIFFFAGSNQTSKKVLSQAAKCVPLQHFEDNVSDGTGVWASDLLPGLLNRFHCLNHFKEDFWTCCEVVNLSHCEPSKGIHFHNIVHQDNQSFTWIIRSGVQNQNSDYCCKPS